MAIKVKQLARFLGGFVLVIGFTVIVLTLFLVGYIKGVADQKSLSQLVSATSIPAAANPSPPKIIYITPKPVAKITWGGPELWEAVNKRRVEFGVNPLKQKDEICTIASIRLNELLQLGQLDGHAGFSTLADRPDIKPTFDKYNIAEFLVSGATSPQNAVDLWENTLGHKKLLSGGEYSWGCIYAQEGFGVAITAY